MVLLRRKLRLLVKPYRRLTSCEIRAQNDARRFEGDDEAFQFLPRSFSGKKVGLKFPLTSAGNLQLSVYGVLRVGKCGVDALSLEYVLPLLLQLEFVLGQGI